MDENIDDKYVNNLENKILDNKNDSYIQDFIDKNDHIKKALLHNKFGCLMLQGGNLEKSEKHLLLSLQTLKHYDESFPYSNVYMNLGNLYAQKKDFQKAIEHYIIVVTISPHNTIINKNEQINQEKNQEMQIKLHGKFNSFNAYVDAHTNLAVMYINTKQKDLAYQYCIKAIKLQPNNFEALINLGDILRQLGKKNEAIQQTWQLILEYTLKHSNEKYQLPQQINCQQIKQQKQQQEDNKEQQEINVVCVKWGTRYNSEYVNKLYRGISKNTKWKIQFYCFTEDPQGLVPQIQPIQLKEEWQRWWCKASLFNPEYGIKGKIFYIDLDMIVTGNLDEIFQYSGPFSILKTDDLACEKDHKQGYNSSIMIWDSNAFEPIYKELKNNFDNITKYIVRFDYWLEMMILQADFLQDLYLGQIGDFVNHCQKEVPENVRIVCFPRKPKPDDYPAPWIEKIWI